MCPSFDLLRNVGQGVWYVQLPPSYTYIAHLSNALKGYCAGLGRLCEKYNFLYALEKVTREQSPTLMVALPLFNSLLKIIVLQFEETSAVLWRGTGIQSACLFLGCIELVYILECMFVQTPHPFNPCIIRNVLCMVSGRVENLCDMGLVFSSREAVVLLSSVTFWIVVSLFWNSFEMFKSENSLLSFAVLIISVPSDQKLLDIFCYTERLLSSPWICSSRCHWIEAVDVKKANFCKFASVSYPW